MSFAHLIFTGPRGVGKTYQAIQTVKALGGVLVCLDDRQARQIKADHGIETISCTVEADRLRGRRIGPLIFDTDAVARIISIMERQIEELRSEKDRYKDALTKAECTLSQLRSVLGKNDDTSS